jgi:hypothetical protein
MVKLWSKNKKLPLRELGSIPVFNRLDTFELQIRAEAWLEDYPELKQIYHDDGLIISFNGKKLILKAHMSNRQYTMWCLKHQQHTNNHI